MGQKTVLSAATIAQLDDESAKIAINRAICAAIGDLEERGSDEKPRKVIITLTLKRTDGGLVECGVQAGWKGPAFKTGSTLGKIEAQKRGQHVLVFSPDSPNDPDQGTLDFPDDGGKPGKE